ncbi:MAG: 50S ribosomal protein L35 [Fimbriimonadaceae bacterium]|nr:MAG: 50S ribosomal protein L35 [Fimbriimonadaceae bacterium]
MPKLKTHKTATKRFKISGSGKIMRRSSGNNHMFFHKSGSQKRRLDQAQQLSKTELPRVKRLLALK